MNMPPDDLNKLDFNGVGRIKNNSSLLPQTSLAFVESLTIPFVQEIVLSADVRCEDCQRRITDIISRMNAETDSVVVNLMEKKVSVICGNVVRPTRELMSTTAASRNSFAFAKLSLLRMIFCSSNSVN